MTNGEMIQSMFPNMNFGTLAQDDVIVNRDYSNNDEPQVFIPKSVWNAEYKEPTIEHEQKIDKSAMMHEIYMSGVNMAGEYQGCWVRFKEIEKIVDRYVR